VNLAFYAVVATRYSYKPVRPGKVANDKSAGDIC
jgi:hypothetical protein